MADGAVKYAQGKTPRLYQAVRGEWRLTIAERRRILLGHIYGVDIDSQAVEVTKLSLLLKVLEGESGDQIARQMNMFHIRALPDLSNNIQCGNSLIGPDFFESRPLDLGDSSIVERVNAFDWWRRFDKIMQEGGFSVIIGNPPYRRELDYKYLMDEIAVTKFGGKYRSPRMDLWYYFVHRGIELLASNGRLGFIVNSYWLYGTGAEKLISQLRKEDLLEEIFYLGELPVFRNVSGSHMILLLRKPTAKRTVTIRQCVRSGETSAEPFATGKAKTIEVDKDLEDVFHDNKIDISLGGGRYLRHLERCPRLGDLGIVRQGIAENPAAINKKTAQKFKDKFTVGAGVFMISKEELRGLKLSASERPIVRPYHDLKDIDRYYIGSSPRQFIIYSTKQTVPDISELPNLKRHLEPYKKIMLARRETRNGSNKWWHLHWPREESIWKTNKIVSLQMAGRPSFALAEGDCYTTFSTNVILLKSESLDLLYRVLAVLNSRLVWAWLSHHAKRRGVGLEINGNVLNKIPIPADIEKTTRETSRLTELAKARVAAEFELRNAKADGIRGLKIAQIESIEAELDKTVYDLFGMTSANIQEIDADTQTQ